ncbi:hypothetical protein Sjap_016446 [Stephania japonica]|uniref:Sister chromatid cohesion 1 protein 2 n=1 Tax=Stephania japonica TaxID=461633 RepID=A0AAP0IL10_9MAGN
MFYSQCLLSRQGPLKSIWVAAYYHKKLNKEQIAETDISSSIDEIMLHEVTVTYRVLGYLLLGVVRIYSKKVEYLYHDCTEVLANINTFALSKKNKRRDKVMCASYSSITLPERFELDAFDLDIVEDISGSSPIPHQLIALEETPKYVGTDYCLEQYNQVVEGGACFVTGPDGFIPISAYLEYNHEQEDADSYIPVSTNLICNQGQECASFETGSAACTPVKDVLSPYLLDTDLVGSSSHHTFNKETSMERLLDYQLPNEECRQLVLFSNFGDRESLEIDTQFNQRTPEELSLDSADKSPERAEGRNLLEIPPLNLENTEPLLKSHLVDITMEENPNEPEGPSCSGTTRDKHLTAVAVTPEFPIVRTPAKKEQVRFSRKRKHACDNAIVLSNDVVRQSLHEPSSLIAKRKKVPLTALDSWKACKSYHLGQDFFGPLLPCASELKELFHGRYNKIAHTEEVGADVPKDPGENGLDAQSKPSEQDAVMEDYVPDHFPSTMCTEIPMALHNLGTLTPVTSNPLSVSSIGAKDMGLNLLDEEMLPPEEIIGGPDEWSVRTRSVARFLCQNFRACKEQREHTPFNLAPVLEGRARKENARLFYEVLVLKTQGFIDVEQGKPYSDVVVFSTPQLEAFV